MNATASFRPRARNAARARRDWRTSPATDNPGHRRTPSACPARGASGLGSPATRSWKRVNRSRASARVRPFTLVVMSDADACEMAQPDPSKLTSSMTSPWPIRSQTRQPVAAERIVALGVGGRRRPWRGSSAGAGCDPGSHSDTDRRDRSSANMTLRTRCSPPTSASTSSRGVVERERGSRGGRHAEPLHQRLGAMVTRADADAVAVQDRADVVRMHAVEHEGEDRRLLARRADEADAGTAAHAARSRSAAASCLVRGDAPSRSRPTDSRPRRPARSRRRCPACRPRTWTGSAAQVDRSKVTERDHVAAALPGRHLLRAGRPAVKHTDARRPEHLVSREGKEVAAERLDVRPRGAGAACAPSTSTGTPAAWASATIRRTGLMVPRAFETCATRDKPRARRRAAPRSPSRSQLAGIGDRRDAEYGAGLRRPAAARARCWSGAPCR